MRTSLPALASSLVVPARVPAAMDFSSVSVTTPLPEAGFRAVMRMPEPRSGVSINR